MTDVFGQLHSIEIGPQRRTKAGDAATYLIIDHHPEPIITEMDQEEGPGRKKAALSLKEIEAAAKAGEVRAQITGTVSEVCVTEGEQVAVGQILVVLEAMKMLNNVTAEVAGKVTDLHVSAGDRVAVGDPLVNISKA